MNKDYIFAALASTVVAGGVYLTVFHNNTDSNKDNAASDTVKNSQTVKKKKKKLKTVSKEAGKKQVREYFVKMFKEGEASEQRILKELEIAQSDRDSFNTVLAMTALHLGVDSAEKLIEKFDGNDHAFNGALIALATGGVHKEPEKVISVLKRENSYLLTAEEIVGPLMVSGASDFTLDEKKTFALDLPTGAGRDAGIGSLGYLLAEEGAEKFEENKEDLVDDLSESDKKNFNANLVNALGQDPEKALEFLQKNLIDRNAFDNQWLKTIGEALYKTEEKDLPYMQAALQSLPEDIQMPLYSGFLTKLSVDQPVAAADKALERFNGQKDDGENFNQVMLFWMSGQPEQAMSYLNQNGVGNTIKHTLVSRSLKQVVQNHPEFVEDLVQSNEFTESHDLFCSELAKRYLNDQPGKAIDYASQLSSKRVQEQVLWMASDRIASVDREKAFMLADAQDDTFVKDTVLTGIYTASMSNSYDDALVAVKKMSDTPEKSKMYKDWFSKTDTLPELKSTVTAELRRVEEHNPELYVEVLAHMENNR